ncbi:MAG: Na+/H+ antiporter subunit E [bacterium]|nr:Na+/H+ antiporter subunit E [bacterium]
MNRWFGRLNKLIGKLYLLIGFSFTFAWFLFRSNLVVLRAIIEPEGRLRPALLAYPLTATGEWEIFTLAHLITLSPGTLSVRHDKDARILWVHALYCHEPRELLGEITQGLERPIMELFS